MAEQKWEEEPRRDEGNQSGIYPGSGAYPQDDAQFITPGEIDRDQNADAPGVEQSDELKDSERLPRKGDDIEEVLD